MKFLIVEDDLVSQEVLKATLGPHGHCEVAENGKIAVAKFSAALANAAPYDLICLDIMMPVMDGQTALKEIRRLEAKHGIGGSDMVKVVMVTALEDAKNVMTAFVRGSCEVYLGKPIFPAKILQVLADFGLTKATESRG